MKNIEMRIGSLWESPGYFLESICVGSRRFTSEEEEMPMYCVFIGKEKDQGQFYNQYTDSYFSMTGGILKMAVTQDLFKSVHEATEGELVLLDTDI